jgi:hypothetical protein
MFVVTRYKCYCTTETSGEYLTESSIERVRAPLKVVCVLVCLQLDFPPPPSPCTNESMFDSRHDPLRVLPSSRVGRGRKVCIYLD